MRKKTYLIISILFIIAVILTAIIYYYGYYTKSKNTYIKIIDNILDTKKNAYNTYKYKTNLNINFQEGNAQINQDILNIINTSNFNLDTQINKTNKQIILNLETDYNNNDLLNMQTCTNVDKKETYIYLKDILNKYIKIDINDKMYIFLNSIMDENKLELFKNKLKDLVNSNNCSSNKEGKVTKNTIKIKTNDFIDALEILDENIKNNMDVSKYNEDEIEFNVYTTGLMKNKIQKVDITIKNKNIKLCIENNTDNEKNNKYYSGLKLILQTEKIKQVTLNLSYDVEDNAKVEFVDTSNSTNIEGLTKDEQIIILDNFKKSNLYNLIKNIITK